MLYPYTSSPCLVPFHLLFPDLPVITWFTATATFGSSPLQPLTAPSNGSPAWGSFPSSISCHSPVIICNSENERENIGACSPLEPVAYTSYSLVASCWAALRGLCQALGGCPLGVITKDTVTGYSSVQQCWICVPLGFLYQLGPWSCLAAPWDYCCAVGMQKPGQQRSFHNAVKDIRTGMLLISRDVQAVYILFGGRVREWARNFVFCLTLTLCWMQDVCRVTGVAWAQTICRGSLLSAPDLWAWLGEVPWLHRAKRGRKKVENLVFIEWIDRKEWSQFKKFRWWCLGGGGTSWYAWSMMV